MLKKFTGFLVLAGGMLFLSRIACFAEAVSSSELINKAKEYDGKTVSFSGEIIGDIMIREGHAWINLNDGKNAIGIWLKKELAKDVLYTGSYEARGDTAEASGRFNRACVEHGGDLDIHAQSLSKISPGNALTYASDLKKISFAIGLFFAIILACLLRTKGLFVLNKSYQK